MITSGMLKGGYGVSLMRFEMPAPKMQVKSIMALQFAIVGGDLPSYVNRLYHSSPGNPITEANQYRAGSMTVSTGVGNTPVYDMPVFGCLTNQSYASRFLCDFEAGRILNISYNSPNINPFYLRGLDLRVYFTIECYE